MTDQPLVVALTGASGAPYAVRVLELLARQRVPVWLIVSSHGWRLLEEECAIGDLGALEDRVGDWRSVTLFDDADRGARPASGSQKTRGMLVCPCSMGTVAAIAHGTSRSLVERAADVTLKEGRKLVLVPRETPLSLIHLRNLTTAAEAGATILPAAPGFYHRPREIGQLVDFVAQRILDQLGFEIEVAPRWGADAAKERAAEPAPRRGGARAVGAAAEPAPRRGGARAVGAAAEPAPLRGRRGTR